MADVLTELIEPDELVGYARGLQFPDLTVLDDLLPDVEKDNIVYEVMRDSDVDVDAAEYRAFDTEAGIGDREGVQRLKGKIPPISRKIKLGEEDTLRLEADTTGENGRLIDAIFDDVARMTRAVKARVVLAKGQVLSTGKVTLMENGVFGEANYGVPGSHFVTAGTAWSDPAASIISDLQAWVEVYKLTNRGLLPGGMVLGKNVPGYMLRNTEFRSLLASLGGVPQLITRQGVDQVLDAYSLPAIDRVVDTQIMVKGVATYLIPVDAVIFIPPRGSKLGETPYGITAEALKLKRGGQITIEQLAGPIATVAETTFDPVVTWTKSAALAIPVLGEPKRLFVADVIP